MNEESERFHKITMKVLTMQLNSITIMDFIAYGGAALGMILAVTQFKGGKVDLSGCLVIILLAADFFLSMRQLGSFFHTAINGIAASDKIFKFLALPEPKSNGKADCPEGDIVCRDLRFSYDAEREILHGIDLSFPTGKLTAVVGESGCGKSTLAALLMGWNKHYTGSIQIGGVELSEIPEKSLMFHITYVSSKSYIFSGTVRDNLLMGKPDATDEDLWAALRKAKLDAFLKSENGLDTQFREDGGNLSGNQRQRLALARALMHDTPVHTFDEATSNIDVESENDIMEQIHAPAETRTVLLLSHRLANVKAADRIYVAVTSDNDPLYRKVCNRISARLNREMNVLELCCGTGQISYPLSSRVRLWEATDFSEKMIAEAKKKNRSCRLYFSVQDATSLPYAPESFDAVVVSNALHIMPYPEKALTEAYRALKPGGLLFAPTIVWGETRYSKIWELLLKLSGFRIYHAWNCVGLSAFIEGQGLAVTESDFLGGKTTPMRYAAAIKKEKGG